MASLRFLFLFAVLGGLSLRAQSTLLDFTYTFSRAPSASFPDSGRELADGVASIPAWGHTDFNDNTSPFVGWDGLQSVSIRFDFGTTVLIDSASFYFADSGGLADVVFPYSLELCTDSDFIALATYPDVTDSHMAKLSAFSLATVRTDHLVLNVEPLAGAWMMMTEASFTGSVAPSAIPEPSTYAALAGAAILGLAIWRRRHGSVES